MSRKLLAFLLSELAVVRIICKACGVVTEMSIEQMGTRLAGNYPSCPCCQKEFVGLSVSARAAAQQAQNPLTQLAQAIQELQAHSKANARAVDIEFVLPDTRD